MKNYRITKDLVFSLIGKEPMSKLFEQEETRQFLKIFKRKTTVKYDCSVIRFIREDTNYLEYSILFYNNDTFIKEQKLIDITNFKDKSLVKKNKKTTISDLDDYLITFGQYSGRRICSLISEEEIDYCKWVISQLEKTNRNSKKLMAFKNHIVKSLFSGVETHI